jgi:hypothetical protein
MHVLNVQAGFFHLASELSRSKESCVGVLVAFGRDGKGGTRRTVKNDVIKAYATHIPYQSVDSIRYTAHSV